MSAFLNGHLFGLATTFDDFLLALHRRYVQSPDNFFEREPEAFPDLLVVFVPLRANTIEKLQPSNKPSAVTNGAIPIFPSAVTVLDHPHAGAVGADDEPVKVDRMLKRFDNLLRRLQCHPWLARHPTTGVCYGQNLGI